MNANVKVTSIPTKFDIWETEYVVNDHGVRIVIDYPCSKTDPLSVGNSWTLCIKKETIPDPNTMALVRKMAEAGTPYLTVKADGSIFDANMVWSGALTGYGWKPEQFE